MVMMMVVYYDRTVNHCTRGACDVIIDYIGQYVNSSNYLSTNINDMILFVFDYSYIIGDQRTNVKDFFVDQEVCHEDQIVIHGG